MRIVVATHALSSFGGTETYVETVAAQLQRTGHDVVVWAPVQGRFAEALRERGLRVAATEAELGGAPDRAHCEGLVEVLERLGPVQAADEPGLREMARLVRVGWAAEAALMGARLDAERALARQAELETELDVLRARGRRAEDVERAAEALAVREADVAERLRLAEEQERAAAAFRTTRRYRLAAALARPADRVRRAARS